MKLRPETPWIVAALFAVKIALPLAAAGDAPGDGLIAEASGLLQQGRTADARPKLEQVISQNPDSAAAGEALVMLGNLDYPRTDFPAARTIPLGAADPAAAEKRYSRAIREFPQGMRTPEAIFRLGLMRYDRFLASRNPAEAEKLFTTLAATYPMSEFAVRARIGAGLCAQERGDEAGAIAQFARAAYDAKDPEQTGWAWFQLGRAEGRLGRYGDALNHFALAQNSFPASAAIAPGPGAAARPLAALALRMLTRAGKLKPDSQYKPPLPPTVKGVSALSAGAELLALDEKSGTVLRIGPHGEILKNSMLNGPVAAAWFDAQTPVVAEAAQIKVGDQPAFKPVVKDKGELRALTRITAVAALPGGTLAVADDRKGVVYRFAASGKFQDAVFETEGHFNGLALDSDGRYWVLDQREKAVYLVTPAGRLAATIRSAVPPGLERPAAIAVDGFDHLWIFDDRGGRIFIYGLDGYAAAVYDLAAATGDKPPALTIATADATGVIHAYDKTAKALLRYR